MTREFRYEYDGQASRKREKKRREKLSRYVFSQKEAEKRNCGEKEFLVVDNEVRRLFLLKYILGMRV